MPRSLYLPNKYRITVGEGSAGFCTVWSDPNLVLSQAPELVERTALLGTLYSREGVNIILRNLALNPDIRHLFLWGNGALSQTPFGLAGKDLLKTVWEKGFDADGKIIGANFSLHREFDLDVIRAVIAGVKLTDVSAEALPAVTALLQDVKPATPYMEPHDFPEHRLAEGQPFPSERVGFISRGKSVIDAWMKVVDRVMRYGVVKETEYGNRQRELIAAHWVIEAESTASPRLPDWPEEVLAVTGAKQEAIERYYPEFMSSDLPEGTAYTYGQRLWAYGRNGGREPVSQIDKVIEHLKVSAVTRRAVATTWDQYVDSDKKTENPPCFVMMQAIQTDGMLHLLATFRSHDIFKAAIPNAFGLRRLHEHLARETGFELGSLSISSNSAHIYEEDWDNATKLLKCALWEREPALAFDQTADADPRGIVLIRIENGAIVADIASPDGATLLTITGRNAKRVYKKIALLDLLSRPDHLLDIGAELQKAEIALERGIAYRQDQPIVFGQP